MSGSVFKRCACSAAELRDHSTGERRTCRKKHGKWWYNRSITDPASGKRQQITRGGFSTRDDAERALNELNSKINAGTWTDDNGITVGAWLDSWLQRKERAGAAFSTLKIYRQHVTDYLNPHLGHVRLGDLRPGHVDALLDALRTTPGTLGEPLSVTTVTRIHACLRSALTTAVKMRLISFNPAKDIELPKTQRKRVKPWQPHELGAFLDHAASHRLGVLFEVIAATGMRRGEALALRWEDVNLTGSSITVKQQLVEKSGLAESCESCGKIHRGLAFTETKTEAGSWRRIDIDSLTSGALLEHQLRQVAEKAEWNEAYDDHGLVFCREDGRPLQPSRITALFHTLTDEVRVPVDADDTSLGTQPLRRVRLHDLRHGAASLLMAAGVDMNVISKRLGHSRSSFTADTYAHMLDGVGREAAEKAAALVPRRRAESAGVPHGC